MFGLFKKKVDRNELIFIFLQTVSSLIEKNGNRITVQMIENKIDEYLNNSKSILNQEQFMTIKSASQLVCLSEELQQKILDLHHSSESETKEKYLKVLDDFQSYGLFC